MKLQNITISSSDKLTLIGNISTMLTAGIPILEIIDTLGKESKGNLKKLLNHTNEVLVEGESLSAAFSHFPRAFSRININILKSAEQSGTLETALRDLRQNIRRDMEFSDKVKSALLYPGVLMTVFSGVFLVILLFVIPRIATVFNNLRIPLPLATRLMIGLSTAITTYTLPISIGLLIFIIGIVLIIRLKRKWFVSLFSYLPLFSSLIREIDLTRFSRNLALLLESGVPLPVALDLCKDVISSHKIATTIETSKAIIIAGGKLSEGLKNTKAAIPIVMVKIIESGEKTGTLDKSMQDIADYMDYNVTNNLKTVTTLLEPVILVLVGVFLGAMMLAIIAPIYNLIGQINGR